MGVTPSAWNFGSNRRHWSKIVNFRSLFTCSDSAVTPSEKVQLTLIGSPLCTFQWAQNGTSYIVPTTPQMLAQKCKVFKIWTISCNNSETVRDRMSVRQLLLITNRKSHSGFRLVPTSMTLNDLKRRNSPYFAFFFTKIDRFWGLLYHICWR